MIDRRKPRDRRHGYTLLEVIVAFVILVLSLSALIPNLASLTGQSGASREVWAATAFARSMIEPIGIAEPLRPGVREGRVAGRWTWRIEIEPYSDEIVPIGAGLYSIVMEVRDRARDRSLTVLRTVRDAGAGR